MVGETQLGSERIAELKPGEIDLDRAAMSCIFDGMTTRQGPNYRELVAQFTVRRDGEVIGVHGAVEAQLRVARDHAPPRPR